MKKIIMETLVVAALAAAGQAQAAPITLGNTVAITATYNGGDVLGFDQGYNAVAGTNTTKLDPNNANVEFLTADALFAFDFTSDGQVLVYANGTPDANGNYKLNFDFANLSTPITSFKLIDGSGAAGTPLLSVVDSDSISLDLSGLSWSQDFTPITLALGTRAVPEPASLALLLAGAAGFAGSRRRRRA